MKTQLFRSLVLETVIDLYIKINNKKILFDFLFFPNQIDSRTYENWGMQH